MFRSRKQENQFTLETPKLLILPYHEKVEEEKTIAVPLDAFYAIIKKAADISKGAGATFLLGLMGNKKLNPDEADFLAGMIRAASKHSIQTILNGRIEVTEQTPTTTAAINFLREKMNEFVRTQIGDIQPSGPIYTRRKFLGRVAGATLMIPSGAVTLQGIKDMAPTLEDAVSSHLGQNDKGEQPLPSDSYQFYLGIIKLLIGTTGIAGGMHYILPDGHEERTAKAISELLYKLDLGFAGAAKKQPTTPSPSIT